MLGTATSARRDVLGVSRSVEIHMHYVADSRSESQVPFEMNRREASAKVAGTTECIDQGNDSTWAEWLGRESHPPPSR